MKDLEYGKDYKYPHDYPANFVTEEYLPEAIEDSVFYEPDDNAKENQHRSYLKNIWKGKYNY